ncbi:hypothetical protein GOODEAATRI_002923 [Goodea atripinnis]|uniref:Uncharacterized protein n=1 Tax=Goodea atripinnis TaxID=208336 RepID=A0ABV0NRE4_9TELE
MIRGKSVALVVYSENKPTHSLIMAKKRKIKLLLASSLCCLFLSFISDQENAEYKTVQCRKVFLDDEDIHFDVENEEERDGQDSYKASLNHLENENASGHLTEHDYHGDDPHYSDESYHYSDDHENFSEDSEHDVDVKQQESVD